MHNGDDGSCARGESANLFGVHLAVPIQLSQRKCKSLLPERPREVTRWVRPVARAQRAAPVIARLSDSVPPLVKYSSPGSAPMHAAITPRAFSSADFASRPYECTEEALPNMSEKYGSMASRTRGSRGVVAV
jgi:hypothetical protein